MWPSLVSLAGGIHLAASRHLDELFCIPWQCGLSGFKPSCLSGPSSTSKYVQWRTLTLCLTWCRRPSLFEGLLLELWPHLGVHRATITFLYNHYHLFSIELQQIFCQRDYLKHNSLRILLPLQSCLRGPYIARTLTFKHDAWSLSTSSSLLQLT